MKCRNITSTFPAFALSGAASIVLALATGLFPGAPLLEISAADPKLGGVFYTIDQVQASRPLKYLKNVVDAFLRYLLFTEETKLTAPIKGSAAFAQAFAATGPRDRRGRSLRDFDLQTRLFMHPCSYLIYSDSFDQLPGELKAVLYQKLYDILTGSDTRPEWSGLSKPSRDAIREILVETKQGLPSYWRPAR